MKHKINVDIHKAGEHSEILLKVVAAHNEGLRSIDPIDIIKYLKVREAAYNCTTCDLGYIDQYAPYKVNISKDQGKTFSLTLEWVEVHDLANPKNDKDDLPDTLFSGTIAKTLTENL